MSNNLSVKTTADAAPTGYGNVGTYGMFPASVATDPAWATPGTRQTLIGLSGTWETMGAFGTGNHFFAQRIA